MQTPYNLEEVKEKVQKLLSKEIRQFSLFGKGAVNNAYLAQTANGEKYIIKQEKDVKEFQPQNTLLVEAPVFKRFCHSLEKGNPENLPLLNPPLASEYEESRSDPHSFHASWSFSFGNVRARIPIF